MDFFGAAPKPEEHRAQADRERLDSDTGPAGGDKMPQLVRERDDGEESAAAEHVDQRY